MKKEKEDCIKKLEEYIEKAKERVKYSLERLDILIISLSSGGLVLALNLFKNFDKNPINKESLSLAWAFFSIALVLNLLSQVTGYLANKYDIKVTKNIINKLKKKDIEGDMKYQEKSQKVFDFLTKWLNIFSFLSLSAGIISLIIFTNSIIN